MSTSSVVVTPRADLSAAETDQTRVRRGRALLACGAVAGPVYLVLGLAQALTRPGFDLSRHELSQLALGDWGWVQVTNFFVSGLLVLLGAVGMARALRDGRGRTWVPRLIAVYGLGLLGAGVFTADAGQGFPLGTPADAVVFSTHGMLHLLFAAIGFLGLIAASIVFGRRCLGQRDSRFGAYSIASGVVFLLTFVSGAGIAGSPAMHSVATLLLWIAVLVGWIWLTATSIRLYGAGR